LARIFAERQARARRQMKWTLVLSACFFAALHRAPRVELET
jgi:hypothetical protein